MKSLLKSVLTVVLVLGCLVGGCYGCVGVCRTAFHEVPPTAEEQAAREAEISAMAEQLKVAKRGDIVVRKYGSVAMIRQEYNGATIQLKYAFGNSEFWHVDSPDLMVREVIHRDNPRWGAYMDHLLYGDALPTSQPTTTQSSH